MAPRMYLAAGVAMVALIAAGEAFISSPPVSLPLSQPGSATTRPARPISEAGSKADNFWKAASLTLFSLSMVRLAQRRPAKAPSRKISVACFAAPTPVATFAVKEVEAVADLIDMTDVTIPEVANTPSCTEQVEQIPEASTSPASSPHAARFIGASRFRSARAHPHRSRATRHAMGKRLCERPPIVTAESSFDVSCLREKIQKGLRISQGRRCGRSREGRGIAASCRTGVGCHSLMEVELHVQKAYNDHIKVALIDARLLLHPWESCGKLKLRPQFQVMDAIRRGSAVSDEASSEGRNSSGCGRLLRL